MNEDLWTKWKTRYKEHGIDPELISYDGIIHPESFEKAPRRILFVLKETDDYAGHSLQELLSEGPKKPMWYAVAEWAYGLLNDFPPHEKIDRKRDLTNSIHSVAAINLKKITGEGSAWPSQINLYARFDRDLLIEQIKSITPEIIFACGTFDILVWLLDQRINPKNIHLHCHQFAPDDLLVINWRHPSRAGGELRYNELRDACANSLTRLRQKADK